MDDDGGFEGFNKLEHAGAITDVQFVVRKVRERLLEPLLVPAGVALRTEEDFALVVVHAMHYEVALMEISADFRANESRRSGDQTGLHKFKRCVTPPACPGVSLEVNTGLPSFCQVLTRWLQGERQPMAIPVKSRLTKTEFRNY